MAHTTMDDTSGTNRRQYGNRMALGTAVQFAGVIVLQVLRFVTNVFIARVFGPAILGIFSLSQSAWSAVGMSFSGGLSSGVMRRLPHHLATDEHREARGVVQVALWSGWLIGGVLGAATYFLSDLIAVRVLNQPEAAPVLRVMALSTPLVAASFAVWSLDRALGSLKFVFYQFMLLPLVFLILTIVAWWLHGGSRLLAWSFLASYLLPLIPMYAHHRSGARALYALTPQLKGVLRPFLSFVGVGSLLWLADFIGHNLDLFLVGRICSASDTGIYGVATRSALLCSMVMVSINSFFLPTISGLYSSGRMDDFRAIFRKGTLWILIIGAPVAIYAMAFAQPIMLFFGKGFVSGAWALWLLAFAQLINQGTGLIASAMSMSNRQQHVLVANLIGVAITLGLCLTLIPRYGLNGAAMAMAASVAFANLSLSIWGYAAMRVSPFSRLYFAPIIAATAAGLVSQWIVPHLPLAGLQHPLASGRLQGTLLVLLVSLAIFMVLYVLGMLALGAKDEALRAVQAVRTGLNRRNQSANV